MALLPLSPAVMALIFGTLGLVFHSDVFVKIKVTVVNASLAAFADRRRSTWPRAR